MKVVSYDGLARLWQTGILPIKNSIVNTDFEASTADAAGKHGLVPAPAAGDASSFLRADGSWATPKNTTYADATETKSGLMSATMLKKLNGIYEGADSVDVTPNATDGELVGTITINGTPNKLYVPKDTNTTYTLQQDAANGHKIGLKSSDSDTVTYITLPDNDTQYSEATETTAGLMSTDMVKKLAGIAAGATKVTIDSSMSDTSTNPAQNKIIKAYVDGKINDLIGGAPDTFDTLKEIADYIKTHQNEYNSLVAIANGKVDKVAGKGLSTNDYTTNEKNKLAGIATGAEVNQNALATVKVGTTTITAGTKQDTITLASGSNVTLTPDASKKTITIAAKDTTYGAATQSNAGLMTADMVKKLAGINDSADAVSFAASLTSGTAIGTITINGTETTLYAPIIPDNTTNEDIDAIINGTYTGSTT